MFSRETLWGRASGSAFWSLPWGLAGACALPWILPEAWDGSVPFPWRAAGWCLLAASLLLARWRAGFGPALALALAWGTLGGLARLARTEGALPAGPVRLQGRLVSPWTRREGRLHGTLRVEGPGPLRGEELPLTLPAAGTPPPAPGTPVALAADLARVEPGPAFLVERPLWRARDGGAARRLRVSSALVLEVLGPARPSPLLALRQGIRTRFQALSLPPAARDLWGAMALGIPPEREGAWEPFRASGTIHLLVVSGLQVTAVMGGLEALWRRLAGRGSPWVAAAGGLAFCALVGFTAPVWRGFLMGLVWTAGRGLGWKPPPVAALHGALLAWLLGHPASGCDPGFLLSWAALTGLLWLTQPLAGLLALTGRPADILTRVLAPWLTTLPLLALFQGGAPLWGPLANLLLVPVVALLAPLCLALTLIPLPGLVGGVAWALQFLAADLVPAFARTVPLATGHLAPWIALLLGWVLLARLHAAFARTRALTVLLAGGSMGLLTAGGTGRAPRSLSLEAVDVGQGDALLLRVPGGEATLVDTGPDARAARRLARVLSRRGVQEPVHLLLTHPHLDHAGGWAALAALWPLASVARPAMDPRPWAPYGPPGGREARILRRGDGWTRGKARFSVRWPPGPMTLRDLNMNSLVLRVRWEDRELWLMGDALALQERDLLDLGDPGEGRDRVLKVGHHGSRSATDAAWVRALDPRVALVCAGRENAFGHPHPEPLAALRDAQIVVTGEVLGARLEARPGGWLLETGRGRRLLLALQAGVEDPLPHQPRHEVAADPGMMGLPLLMGLGAHLVGHAQDRAAGHAGLVAGREDPGEFQVLHVGQGAQAAGAVQGLGDARGHGHGGGWEGKGRRPGARPVLPLDTGPDGPAFHQIQGDGHGPGGPHQRAHRQVRSVGSTGAHEQHAIGPAIREEPGSRHRRREGPYARAGHPPSLGRGIGEAGQFGGEGRKEQGGGAGHGPPWYGGCESRGPRKRGAEAPLFRGNLACYFFSSRTAWAAARVATGTRYGLQLT
jgi:competence protein ComEC